MEIHKARIVRSESNAVLCLAVKEKTLDIALTEDKPNDVKIVFNKLLEELKNGVFNFELDDSKEDLYHHISKEYITQLNAELSSVFKELGDFDLLNKK
jgi:hypothetical protein